METGSPTRSDRDPHLDFSFPLNLYAHLLWLEEGKLEALHLGVFEDPSEPASLAQRRATDRFLRAVPPPPATLLEVGCGVGTTARELVGRGYRVVGISPERAQIEIARKRCPEGQFLQARFEEAALPPGPFDALLLQESAQYLDPLVLFDRALDLLKPRGRVVIFDEFARFRRDRSPEPLHLLKDFLNQAGRFGFEVISKEDLSAKVLPSFDWLCLRIEKHRQRLLVDLDLDPEQLDRLQSRLEDYRKRYLEGRFGYFGLILERRGMPPWRLRESDGGRTPQIWELFRESFGLEKPPAWWRWKYREAKGIAAWQGGAPIAFYAGFPRKISWYGRPVTSVQIGDVMVHPKARARFTKRGAFFACMTTFAERWTGYGRPFPIGFGFPNPKAMRLGVRLGLYAKVGEVFGLSWNPSPPPPLYRAEPLSVDGHRPILLTLWRAMARDFRRHLIAVRDPDWWRYRYVDCPDRDYRLYLVRQRFTGWPVGAIALREEGERTLLVDLVGPKVAFRALVDQARALTGGKPLYAWASDGALSAFAITSPKVEPLEVEIPTCIWTEGPDPETLRGRWFLLAGDTDFL